MSTMEEAACPFSPSELLELMRLIISCMRATTGIASAAQPSHDLEAATCRVIALQARQPAQLVHSLWCGWRAASLRKLRAHVARGDTSATGERLSSLEWAIVDLLLLYDVAILSEASYQPLQLEALDRTVQLVQQFHLEVEEVPPEQWARAAASYSRDGVQLSALALQRRWHELKLDTRRRACAPSTDAPLLPIHQAVATRYPHVVSHDAPPWRDLVASGGVAEPTPVPRLRVERPSEPSPGVAEKSVNAKAAGSHSKGDKSQDISNDGPVMTVPEQKTTGPSTSIDRSKRKKQSRKTSRKIALKEALIEVKPEITEIDDDNPSPNADVVEAIQEIDFNNFDATIVYESDEEDVKTILDVQMGTDKDENVIRNVRDNENCINSARDSFITNIAERTKRRTRTSRKADFYYQSYKKKVAERRKRDTLARRKVKSNLHCNNTTVQNRAGSVINNTKVIGNNGTNMNIKITNVWSEKDMTIVKKGGVHNVAETRGYSTDSDTISVGSELDYGSNSLAIQIAQYLGIWDLSQIDPKLLMTPVIPLKRLEYRTLKKYLPVSTPHLNQKQSSLVNARPKSYSQLYYERNKEIRKRSQPREVPRKPALDFARTLRPNPSTLCLDPTLQPRPTDRVPDIEVRGDVERRCVKRGRVDNNMEFVRSLQPAPFMLRPTPTVPPPDLVPDVKVRHDAEISNVEKGDVEMGDVEKGEVETGDVEKGDVERGRKVHLPDMEVVRRNNRGILTAEVAPLVAEPPKPMRQYGPARTKRPRVDTPNSDNVLFSAPTSLAEKLFSPVIPPSEHTKRIRSFENSKISYDPTIYPFLPVEPNEALTQYKCLKPQGLHKNNLNFIQESSPIEKIPRNSSTNVRGLNVIREPNDIPKCSQDTNTQDPTPNISKNILQIASQKSQNTQNTKPEAKTNQPITLTQNINTHEDKEGVLVNQNQTSKLSSYPPKLEPVETESLLSNPEASTIDQHFAFAIVTDYSQMSAVGNEKHATTPNIQTTSSLNTTVDYSLKNQSTSISNTLDPLTSTLLLLPNQTQPLLELTPITIMPASLKVKTEPKSRSPSPTNLESAKILRPSLNPNADSNSSQRSTAFPFSTSLLTPKTEPTEPKSSSSQTLQESSPKTLSTLKTPKTEPNSSPSQTLTVSLEPLSALKTLKTELKSPKISASIELEMPISNAPDSAFTTSTLSSSCTPIKLKTPISNTSNSAFTTSTLSSSCTPLSAPIELITPISNTSNFAFATSTLSSSCTPLSAPIELITPISNTINSAFTSSLSSSCTLLSAPIELITPISIASNSAFKTTLAPLPNDPTSLNAQKQTTFIKTYTKKRPVKKPKVKPCVLGFAMKQNMEPVILNLRPVSQLTGTPTEEMETERLMCKGREVRKNHKPWRAEGEDTYSEDEFDLGMTFAEAFFLYGEPEELK